MAELTRENAVKIDEWMGDIDTAVKRLTEYQKMGRSVYVNFNGHKLYSCDITLDGAYKEITGMTKAESIKAREEAIKKWELERKERKEQAERKIPEWISEGEKSIYPERAEDWQYYVETSARQGMYDGRDIDSTLEIMGMLESGASFEEVEKKLEEQGNSGHSYSIVTKNVLHFSKNGPDFYEAVVLKGKPDPESAMALEEIRKENEVFAKRLDKNAPVSLLDKLKGIKKDELSERKFYEQVLSVVKEMRESYEITKDEEAFVSALREIGCLSSEEWMEAKRVAGEQVPELTVGEGIRSADIGTAVNIISNYMSSPDFMQLYMNDRIWDEEWVQNSIEMEKGKLKIPYYQVAQQALMNWNGLSEEQAQQIILEQSFEEIDSHVYAKGSMDYAIDGIVRYFSEKMNLPTFDSDRDELADFVYNGGKSGIADAIRSDAAVINGTDRWAKGPYPNIEKNMDNMIMDTLFAVHDGWVQDNQKKFMAREKKHQHMPSELIGWKEAKADLLFVKPIFESLGVKVDEDRLHELYNERVKDFLLDRGITTSRQLSDAITQGEEFYPALANYGDVLVTINDPEYVDEHVIPAIEQNGIGKVEEIRQEIIDGLIADPNPDEISRLTEEEQERVEQSLGQEVSTLTAQRDKLHQKNSIVQRIMDLAARRKSLNEEISMEEQRKSENLHEFDY